MKDKTATTFFREAQGHTRRSARNKMNRNTNKMKTEEESHVPNKNINTVTTRDNHSRTTERRWDWTDHRGSCCVMWPSSRLSPWARWVSVVVSWAGGGDYPELIGSSLHASWSSESSQIQLSKSHVLLAVGLWFVCVCVHHDMNRVPQSLLFFLNIKKKVVVGGNASFWVKCVRGAFAANVFGAVLLCLQVFFVQDWKFNYSNRERGLKEGSGLKLVFVWCLLGFERVVVVNVRVSFTNFRSIFNLFLINF